MGGLDDEGERVVGATADAEEDGVGDGEGVGLGGFLGLAMPAEGHAIGVGGLEARLAVFGSRLLINIGDGFGELQQEVVAGQEEFAL